MLQCYMQCYCSALHRPSPTTFQAGLLTDTKQELPVARNNLDGINETVKVAQWAQLHLKVYGPPFLLMFLAS